MANRIVITGRLVSDPELRTTQSDVEVVKFRIACKRPFAKNDITDFFDVVAWRGLAGFTCKYFVKGKLIEIDGRLQTSPWEDKNGAKHQGVIILAEQVSFVGDKPKEEQADKESGSAPASANQFGVEEAVDDDLPF